MEGGYTNNCFSFRSNHALPTEAIEMMNKAKKVIVLALVIMALGMLYFAVDSLRTAFNFTDVRNPTAIFGSLMAIIMFVLLLLGMAVLLACAYSISVREYEMGKCKFYKICELKQKEGKTCNHPTAENGYCGKYRQLKGRLS